MSDIQEIQGLVLHSLEKDGEEEETALSERLRNHDFLYPSSEVVLEALKTAQKTLAEKDIFAAAFAYHTSIKGYETRGDRERREEVLRLLFLLHDKKSGRASRSDLRDFLIFLSSRVEIRAFSEDATKAIAYIESIYGEDVSQVLESLTSSQPSTIKNWLGGSNPTKSSRETIAAAAEVLYQLHAIKGWKEERSREWFEKNAREELGDWYGSYWNFFPNTLRRKMEKMGLVVVGTSSWF